MNHEIYVVGANGTMGSALIARSGSVGLTEHVVGLTRTTENYGELVRSGNLFILCTKQRDTLDWLERYGRDLREGTVVLSLAALLDIDLLRNYCGNQKVRIGRIMTTTGIAQGNEEIVWTSDGDFKAEQIEEVHSFLSHLGHVTYLGEKQDQSLERKTYRACMVGWLADTCAVHEQALKEELGFTDDEALEALDNALVVLARQRSLGLDYETCRNNVMSRGGLTEAGVSARKDQLVTSVKVGLQAALSRSHEIMDYFTKKGLAAETN